MGTETALLAGATGLVGGHLLPLLLDRYQKVTVLTRRKLEQHHPHLEQVITDFDRLPTITASDVYCALGSTIKKAGSREAFRRVDYEYPLIIARHAAGGARQFLLVSSVGADLKSSNFYLHTKGELENALAALPFTSLHLFRPSFLIGQRTEHRAGEKWGTAVAKTLEPLLLGPLRKYRAIEAAVLARAMVAAAAQASPGRHRYAYDEIRLTATPSRTA